MQPSRDGFKYFEYGMHIGGWLAPAKANKFYPILQAFVLWAIMFEPLLTCINFIKEIDCYAPGELLTSIQAGINNIGLPVKVTWVFLNMWRIHKAKELLSGLDEYSKEKQECIQIGFGIRRCNSIFLMYQITYFGYSTSTYLTSIINGVAPWRLYNPFFDWREGTAKLWLASTMEYVIMQAIGMQHLLLDSYPLLCGTIMRVHIQLLQQKIRSLRTDSSETARQSYEQLVKCIKNHQLILEYANLIRPILSITIFIQFVVIGVVLGIALVNLLIFANFWSGLATLLYIAGLMIQTFPFCYTCDQIKDDCATLTLAIFHSNWLDANRGYKSTLLYFLQNAQTPIAYTAGSAFPICLETNVKVAKLAFSVVAFVKQLNLAEKLRGY